MQQNTSWLERKYIVLLCNRFRNYKKKSPNLYNFSCPICGDSTKNTRKARGYVYERGGSFFYHCHNNCGPTIHFSSFLKDQDSVLYSEYVKERYMKTCTREEKCEELKKEQEKTKFKERPILSELKKISQLPYNHFAKQYIESRRIPTPYHAKLFFAPKFMEWTNTVLPDKFAKISHDQPRIIIPFYTSRGKLFGYQGRSILPVENDIRYITILMDDSVPRLYGMESVDLNRTHYVLEGPIDSMFIPNSMASAGGDIVSELSRLGGQKENTVVLLDNEKRKKETIKIMKKAIRQGYKVFIWPDSVETKDINAFVLSQDKSVSLDKIQQVVQNMLVENTFSGLQAELRLTQWQKT